MSVLLLDLVSILWILRRSFGPYDNRWLLRYGSCVVHFAQSQVEQIGRPNVTGRGAIVFAELYARHVNGTYLLCLIGVDFALYRGRKRRRKARLLYVYFLIGRGSLFIA